MIWISVLITAVLFSTVAIVIRWMAAKQIWWVFIPTNTFALVTTQKNKDVDLTKGGGGLVDVIHNIPGMKLNKDNPAPWEWHFEAGSESTGILKLLLGVDWIGPFRYLQTNKIKSFRYTREEKETEFSIKPKSAPTDFIFYSSEQAVKVSSAETKDFRELSVVYNIIFANKYPVRVALKVADAYAILSQLAEAQTILTTGKEPIEYFLGSGSGASGGSNGKTDLVNAINNPNNKAVVLRQVGIEMLEVNLLSLDPTDATRKLLELAADTVNKNAAAIAEATAKAEQVRIGAEAQASAKERLNRADEDRLNRVILPLGQSPGAVRVREAEAYENNPHVTVYAPGGNAGIMVQAGSQAPRQPAAMPAAPVPAATPQAPAPAQSAPQNRPSNNQSTQQGGGGRKKKRNN